MSASGPTEIYAVVSGEHDDYEVHAAYRSRARAQRRVDANNSTTWLLLDGQPATSDEVCAAQPTIRLTEDDGWRKAGMLDFAAQRSWWSQHVARNPAREEIDDMRVEVFDFYDDEEDR